MTEKKYSEWDRYPSGISQDYDHAVIEGVQKAEGASKALNLPFEELKFHMVSVDRSVYWRFEPKKKK